VAFADACAMSAMVTMVVMIMISLDLPSLA
jgi:hypothetical protein